DEVGPDHSAAVTGDNPRIDMGVGEPRTGRGKDDITEQRQGRSEADGRAIDGGDDRSLGFQHIADQMPAAARRRGNWRLVQGLLVTAGAEPATRAGQHDGPYLRIPVEVTEDLLDLFMHRPSD